MYHVRSLLAKEHRIYFTTNIIKSSTSYLGELTDADIHFANVAGSPASHSGEVPQPSNFSAEAEGFKFHYLSESYYLSLSHFSAMFSQFPGLKSKATPQPSAAPLKGSQWHNHQIYSRFITILHLLFKGTFPIANASWSSASH